MITGRPTTPSVGDKFDNHPPLGDIWTFKCLGGTERDIPPHSVHDTIERETKSISAGKQDIGDGGPINFVDGAIRQLRQQGKSDADNDKTDDKQLGSDGSSSDEETNEDNDNVVTVDP